MQRPTVVTVFGVLNIIFGSLGLLCAPFGLLWTLKPDMFPRGPGPDPVRDIMAQSPELRNWLIAMTVVGMVAATFLLAAGIGLLQMKSWGRTISLVYGIYGIISALANMAVQYFLLIVPLMEKGRGQPEVMAGAVGGAIGGLLGGCFGMIYPILLLCFMNLGSVTRAFQQAGEPLHDQFRDDYRDDDRYDD